MKHIDRLAHGLGGADQRRMAADCGCAFAHRRGMGILRGRQRRPDQAAALRQEVQSYLEELGPEEWSERLELELLLPQLDNRCDRDTDSSQ